MLSAWLNKTFPSFLPSCQERAKEELRKRQQKERDQVVSSVDQETVKSEKELKRQLDEEQERTLRETRNRLAAEAAARTDLTKEQMAAVSSSNIFKWVLNLCINYTYIVFILYLNYI